MSIPGAGVNVATVSPADIVAVADENAMQLAKLSSETWIEPVHAPAVVCPVKVVPFIAVENVTAMVDDASGVAPSAGVVLTTVTATGVKQVPLPSHCVPPIEQGVPAPVGGFDGAPIVQISLVH